MSYSLAHVMVVGGTPQDWATMGDERLVALVEGLGRVVWAAGGAWLTLRAYQDGRAATTAGPEAAGSRRLVPAADGHVTVIIDPMGDGRQRFADAMRHLPAGAVVDEKRVAGVLYDPADVEPDLVLVLGPPTRLPPSLVWELAYGELVFDARPLDELAPEHLEAAIEAFGRRRRRFGGLDT